MQLTLFEIPDYNFFYIHSFGFDKIRNYITYKTLWNNILIGYCKDFDEYSVFGIDNADGSNKYKRIYSFNEINNN